MFISRFNYQTRRKCAVSAVKRNQDILFNLCGSQQNTRIKYSSSDRTGHYLGLAEVGTSWRFIRLTACGQITDLIVNRLGMDHCRAVGACEYLVSPRSSGTQNPIVEHSNYPLNRLDIPVAA